MSTSRNLDTAIADDGGNDDRVGDDVCLPRIREFISGEDGTLVVFVAAAFDGVDVDVLSGKFLGSIWVVPKLALLSRA